MKMDRVSLQKNEFNLQQFKKGNRVFSSPLRHTAAILTSWGCKHWGIRCLRELNQRALTIEPSLLLLDEPLSNLDARQRESMRAVLKQVQRDTGLPILYVAHDQNEAMAMSDWCHGKRPAASGGHTW